VFFKNGANLANLHVLPNKIWKIPAYFLRKKRPPQYILPFFGLFLLNMVKERFCKKLYQRPFEIDTNYTN
jgi:hypothetical protein